MCGDIFIHACKNAGAHAHIRIHTHTHTHTHTLSYKRACTYTLPVILHLSRQVCRIEVMHAKKLVMDRSSLMSQMKHRGMTLRRAMTSHNMNPLALRNSSGNSSGSGSASPSPAAASTAAASTAAAAEDGATSRSRDRQVRRGGEASLLSRSTSNNSLLSRKSTEHELDGGISKGDCLVGSRRSLCVY